MGRSCGNLNREEEKEILERREGRERERGGHCTAKPSMAFSRVREREKKPKNAKENKDAIGRHADRRGQSQRSVGRLPQEDVVVGMGGSLLLLFTGNAVTLLNTPTRKRASE